MEASSAQEIRDKLSHGQLEESLDIALLFLKDRDHRLYSECIQHKGRLSEFNRQFRLRIISFDALDMVRAQVSNSLIEVISPRIEALEKSVSTPDSPDPYMRIKQTSTQANQSNNSPPSPSPESLTPPEYGSVTNHDLARQLIGDFIKLLLDHSTEYAAKLATPYLHRTLLQGEFIQPQFKQLNFDVAHARASQYVRPINFTKVQKTNRTSIGSLGNKEHGEEYLYTLEKATDNGGIPGTVRIFYPSSGDSAKITLVSF
jgi:hypothetical protein